MTFGQLESSKRAHKAYAQISADDWPCNIQQCPNCYIHMPAGYAVCISCHSPFIFVAVVDNVPMSCKGVSAAPAM
eukprot:726761-Heterocapsa_arctica.AAC.1